MRASPAPPSLPPTSPTFAVKACLSFYEDNAPLPLPFLRRVQCGRMEVGLSAIKTSLLLFPPALNSALKGEFLDSDCRSNEGGGGTSHF